MVGSKAGRQAARADWRGYTIYYGNGYRQILVYLLASLRECVTGGTAEGGGELGARGPMSPRPCRGADAAEGLVGMAVDMVMDLMVHTPRRGPASLLLWYYVLAVVPSIRIEQ